MPQLLCNVSRVHSYKLRSLILRSIGHIYPLVRSLKDIHHFDVETQVQYYAPLAIERTMTDEGAIIEEDQVKAFVNSADWNLGRCI